MGSLLLAVSSVVREENPLCQLGGPGSKLLSHDKHLIDNLVMLCNKVNDFHYEMS